MTDHIAKLLDDTEQHLAAILANARKAAAANPSKGAIEAAQAAEAALREHRERNRPADEQAAPEGERFKNRIQALNWLQAQGYKVSQGKFYTDCKAGFPAIHRDGSISRYQVMQYGQQLDIERRTSQPADSYERDRDEARKIRAEAEIKEMQAENLKRKLSVDWAHRGEVYTTWAAIMGDLYTAMIHNLSYHTGQIIPLVGGDQKKGPHLDEMLVEIVNKGFNEVGMVRRIDGCFTTEEIDNEMEDDTDAA